MKKVNSREFKIGLVTILCALTLFFGIDYLKGVNIFKPDNYYYIKYQNVEGLSVSGPVNLDGFKVGLIHEIMYDYKNPGNVIVEISIDKSLKIPAGSKAVLVKGLMGESEIQLQLNKYVQTVMPKGDTLVGVLNAGMMGTVTEKILPAVEELLPKIDSILSGLDQIVNHSGLQSTFQNINTITANLNTASTGFTRMMNKDVPVIMGNLRTTTDNFAYKSQELRSLDINKTIASANATLENLQSLTARMDSKESSLGLLLNDDKLYRNLSSTASHADSLMIDLKENPKRYVHFSIW